MSGTMPDVSTSERRVSRNVEELLNSISGGLQRRHSVDSDDTSVGGKGSAEGYSSLDQTGVRGHVRSPLAYNERGFLSRHVLHKKSVTELETLCRALLVDVKLANNTLIHYLKVRDKYIRKRTVKCDLITACLQAMSPKRSVDTMIRFSVEPTSSGSGFTHWWAAMKMASRVRGGVPPQFRKKLWLSLADKHMETRHIDWERTKWSCLNERSNPDDENLGAQIVKDLHRTGCSLFSGAKTEENQALLKMVLLAYARWNKMVGYCQGFNMLAAILLEVMEWREDKALKVMIYLIEGVLPTRYFTQNMRDLSVDMAVFRDLLQNKLPSLAQHLNKLQAQAQDSVTGASYEPPLLNVFTMQWFLTLFSTCLPKVALLRIWDLVFLDGNHVLLQTALAIWTGLEKRVMTVQTADEFYSIMGSLTREMLEFGIMETNDLIHAICNENPLSPSELASLRDKYAYNIRPLSSSSSTMYGRQQWSPNLTNRSLPTPGNNRASVKLFFSDDEGEEDTDSFAMATWCLSNSDNMQRNSVSAGSNQKQRGNSKQQSKDNPQCEMSNGRMSLDISSLKKQYAKIKERQKLAHIIMTGAYACSRETSRKPLQVAVNNLLVGKKPLVRKSRPSPGLQFDLKHDKSSARDSKQRFENSRLCLKESIHPDVVCLPETVPPADESRSSSKSNSTLGSCDDVYESLEESTTTDQPSQNRLSELA